VLPLRQPRRAARRVLPNLSLIAAALLVSSATLPTGRFLSKLTDHLYAYKREPPIGAPRPTTFLLGIFSTSREKEFLRRELIRKTYLDIGDPRICKLEEFIRQFEETPNERVCQVPYTFVIGGGGSHRPADHDDDEPVVLDTDQNGHADPQRDCTYLNIRENMEDGKSPTWIKYAADIAAEYGIDYVSKIDDDSVISPHLLFQFIADDLPPVPYNRRIYGGSALPSYLYHLMYGAGQFYFMSADVADYVGHELTAEDRKGLRHSRPIEDLDMGSFVYNMPKPVKFLNMRHYEIWTHPKKTEEQWSNAWEVELDEQLPKAMDPMPFWFFCPIFLSGKGI